MCLKILEFSNFIEFSGILSNNLSFLIIFLPNIYSFSFNIKKGGRLWSFDSYLVLSFISNDNKYFTH